MSQEIPYPTECESCQRTWALFRSCRLGEIHRPGTLQRGACCSALGQFLLPEAGDWARPIPMHPPEGIGWLFRGNNLVLPFFFHHFWWIRGVESHPLEPFLPCCFHIQPGSSNHYNYGYHLGQTLGWQGPIRRWLSPWYPPLLHRSDKRVCVSVCVCTCVFSPQSASTNPIARALM